MMEQKIPYPSVLGNYTLQTFYGDAGQEYVEVTDGANCIIDSERINWDQIAAVAGLLNACEKTLYDLDKEMAANNGHFPDALSVSLAADVNTLIRHAMSKFR